MKKLFIIVLLLLGYFGNSQNPDLKRTFNWDFGYNVSFSYLSGVLSSSNNTAINAEEGCASISDTCGNLLFYTDGDSVWNSLNNVILNGTGIGGCFSSTQAAIIVPLPLNDSLFYIFTTDCGENNGLYGLEYSVVNINGDFGNGEVITKNNLLHSPISEKLSVVRTFDGTGFWILSHELNTGAYYCFLLTSSGINLTPVISNQIVKGPMFADGYMTLNSNGTMVSSAFHLSNIYRIDTLEICKFNDTTGVVYQCISIPMDTLDELYGTCFSRDGNKLYVTSYNVNTTFINKIFQFDLSYFNSDSIINSKKIIIASNNHWFYGCQLNPFGEMLFAQESIFSNDSMSSIAFPDSSLGSINFSLSSVFLNGGRNSTGVPNFVSSFLQYDSNISFCTTDIGEINNTFQVLCYPNPVSSKLNFDVLCNQKEKFPLKVEIFDLFGYLQIEYNLTENENHILLNLEKLLNGTYLFKVTNSSNQKFEVYKIIKT